MTFYFGEKKGDESMLKINLRDMGSRAKVWNHPIEGLLRFIPAFQESGRNMLKIPKKVRELYTVSIVALAMRETTGWDWWINMPENDPPDGLVMTLVEQGAGLKGNVRELEVVEHRDQPEELFATIRDKMVAHFYTKNTVLVCLVLTPGIYDLQALSKKLEEEVSSPLEYVFVVFAGFAANATPAKQEEAEVLSRSFTMTQLLPHSNFCSTTVDLKPHLDHFQAQFEKGQESRIIDGKEVHYATSNKKKLGE